MKKNAVAIYDAQLNSASKLKELQNQIRLRYLQWEAIIQVFQ